MAWAPNQQQFLAQQMQAFNQVPAFDISREALLTWPLPPIPSAPRSSTATHASTYRLAWGELRLWDTFAGEVTNYWQNLPHADKAAMVYTQTLYHGNAQRVARTIGPPTNEGDVKDRQGTLVPDIHNYAAVGLDNAPMPSDAHSAMAHINPGGHTNLTVDGCPDFVFSKTRNNPHFEAWDPYTILGEVKCPWLVTPARIDQVLHTINPQGFPFHVIANSVTVNPILGDPAQLAVEQIFGYMVRNACLYGIISTFKGWCFLQRYNGGILRMTPMYGDFFALLGISNGAAAEGYHVPFNFSIMKALYYLSHLADATPKVPETPLNGVAGQVELPMSSAQQNAPAARIIQPYQPNQGQMAPVSQYGQAPGGYQAGVHIIGGYENAVSIQYNDGVTYKFLKFEPWLKANCLGVKTWIARTLPDNEKIILKLWDAWKYSSEDQGCEASIYLKLRPLWGIYVPALRVQSPLEFYYALIIEYIEVIPPIIAFLRCC